MSLFVWYFGTRRKYDDVPHHTILLGPRYKELLTDIFERKILADDFSLYLHRPTATDPSLAPDGCDAFYVLSPVPHLQSGTDWGVTAEKYRSAIARELGNTMLPDLESQIVTSHMLTPQDFQDRLLSFRGAAFGLEPILTQSAWFRPHNMSEDIANLYSGRRRHPSRRRLARCALVRPGPGFADARRSTSFKPGFGDRMTIHLDPADIATCRALLKGGSRTFHAAAKVLPRGVADPAIALYAFCRLADDAVDLGNDRMAAVARLRDRLDRAYRGQPMNLAADRAFADVVAKFGIPRELPEAMLEGLAWDAEGRRYETLRDLAAYAARVAGSVGAMMTLVMGQRAPEIVARACDLGVAMQLTNIARDVGEDARAGRLYLPLQWLREAGTDPDAWLAKPVFTPEIAAIVQRAA